MKATHILAAFLFMGLSLPECHARGRQKDSLCAEVKAFLASVKPDEKRAVTLRTFWGAQEDGDQIIFGSKTCEHQDYEPGKKLCSYLIQESSMEFAGYNAKRILNCVTTQSEITKELEIHSGSFSTIYGSPNRGALVDLRLVPGGGQGEMALYLQADGY